MSAGDGARAVYERLVTLARAPAGEGALDGATHQATLTNPLCGDRVTVRLLVEGGVVRRARFEARGCALARASAALLVEVASGHSVADLPALAGSIDLVVAASPPADLGPLEPLRGAHQFPARTTCVTLAWRALEAALAAGGGPRP
jgi:nitrogen fixation NifU-like protein